MTSSFVDEYTIVLRNLSEAEMVTSGVKRTELALAAVAIARLIRRQTWNDDAERQAGLALAAQAEEISNKCILTDRPIGQG